MYLHTNILTHIYDHTYTGDGRLNKKEFKNLLQSFGISLTDSEQETLLSRFDNDQDGGMFSYLGVFYMYLYVFYLYFVCILYAVICIYTY